ncbi:MAG: methylated-DNA--[protein]-cysteine S-methyltransferase [Acidimicrobiales bacterium]|jgi:methylated-DNA-[protein]-cysteine S-methyltransferase
MHETTGSAAATDGAVLTTVHPSPIGPLTLMARDGRLTHLVMADQAHATATPPESRIDDEFFADVNGQLDEYFAGTRTSFDVPMWLEGTEFQRRVWAQLCAIPYGETISYGELARRVGNPKAARAVGLANGRNPMAVIVPCHRVIAADGSLGGYGGGADRKTLLLDLERANRT